MKKPHIKVRIGKGSVENITKIKTYLTAILPLWEECGRNPPDIIIGGEDDGKPILFKTSKPIDEVMASSDEKIQLGNCLKLVAAELWLQEEPTIN